MTAHGQLIPIWRQFYSFLQRVSFEKIQAFSESLWDSLEPQECLIRVVVVQLLSHVWLFATPCTVAHQSPLYRGFPRQEYCSGLGTHLSNTKGFFKETQASTQYWHPYISALLFWGFQSPKMKTKGLGFGDFLMWAINSWVSVFFVFFFSFRHFSLWSEQI